MATTVFGARHRQPERPQRPDHSKQLTRDVRPLLWIVTIGGLLLAFYSVHKGYSGALPWISTMVGLPWTAYGTICSFYMNMSKSDHKEGGITFEAAKANGFTQHTTTHTGSENSPGI